ncbi:HU family DNA-binding protein [uncultured Aliiroseovarius sp.]|uniref:HU family DNA-binding protein n=1 Tax=uncultured Aliiroseovarius sp. TaxID=1658783 RepID=UPI0026229D80|nr:HU family DNA-binding protein [uncultured Aliiroseovarius sp.]
MASKPKSPATATRKTTAKAPAAAGSVRKTASTPVPRKTSTSPKTAASAKPAAGFQTSDAVVSVVNKKAMLARVAARANVQPNKAREVYEAVLEELGDALLNGDTLKLPPLGTLKVNRQKELPNANIVICKLRRKKPSAVATDPLAPTSE